MVETETDLVIAQQVKSRAPNAFGIKSVPTGACQTRSSSRSIGRVWIDGWGANGILGQVNDAARQLPVKYSPRVGSEIHAMGPGCLIGLITGKCRTVGG